MERYKCKCDKCGHEWTYIPRRELPARRVTCPKCKKPVDFLTHCTPL